jgi:hypothetical protein
MGGGPLACLSPCRPSVLCSVVLREASLCRKGEDTRLLNGVLGLLLGLEAVYAG